MEIWQGELKNVEAGNYFFPFGRLLNRLEKVTTAKTNQMLAGMTLRFPEAKIVR